MSDEQLWLMMERDGLINEMGRWKNERSKLQKEAKQLEDEISKTADDTKRLERLKKLRERIIMMRNTDHLHDEDGGKARDEMIAEELPRATKEYAELLAEGKSDLWKRRRRLYEKIIHYNEELVTLRGKIKELNTKITPLPITDKLTPFTGVVDHEPYPEPDYRTKEEVLLEEAEWQIDAMIEAAEWEAMSTERELRKKDEAIQKLQIQNLEEYIDQLEGLDQDINPNWEKSVNLLDAQGGLIGKMVDVYFENQDKQRKTLAVRYKEDLQGKQKWVVKVLNKDGKNKYEVERDGKTYTMALGVNERNNHIVCFSFMSKTQEWFNTYKEIGGPSNSLLRNMTAYECYQWYDKVEKHLQEKKGQA